MVHNTKPWYMNQNIQLVKIYNLYIIFPICQEFKRNMPCSMKSALTGAHSSTLVSAAFEYPVTIEVIYFYFHPAIAESIPVLYTVFRHLLKSYSCIWGFYTILL